MYKWFTESHSYGTSLAIWDHSVTCHPIQVNARPALTLASKPVLDLPTPEGWKAELTWATRQCNGGSRQSNSRSNRFPWSKVKDYTINWVPVHIQMVKTATWQVKTFRCIWQNWITVDLYTTLHHSNHFLFQQLRFIKPFTSRLFTILFIIVLVF